MTLGSSLGRSPGRIAAVKTIGTLASALLLGALVPFGLAAEGTSLSEGI
jgi:hypothetical protein